MDALGSTDGCQEQSKAGRRSAAGTGSPDQDPPDAGSPKEDPRLTRVTEIALALPEASSRRHGSHAAFLVRKKTFGYFLNDHHGDGIVAITCKVFGGDNTALAEAQPRRFYLPAYLASKGWVALRLDTGKIDWDEVRELLNTSYRLIAPTRLAALVATQD
jgi:predicted DNA-binding protein (MmcQ/YjbR family)